MLEAAQGSGAEVYPRVGGATGMERTNTALWKGLSPRGRGNRRLHQRGGGKGSIPAWAGQPTPSASANSPVWGLSPRGRGNLFVALVSVHLRRSIPAWAGQPPSRPSTPSYKSVYPRVGGATIPSYIADSNPPGLSPRGRGNHDDARRHRCSSRSIPAWAGQPSPKMVEIRSVRVYPRVGGATSCHARHHSTTSGLSPRGRGNHDCLGNRYAAGGSIPAWAGQPHWGGFPAPILRVYPRVGGATVGCGSGKCPLSRSIPAWAGQPFWLGS